MTTFNYTPQSDNTLADVSDINTPFQQLQTIINGNLDSTNIAAGSINADRLAGGANPQQLASDTVGNYVVSGLTAPVSASLSTTLALGRAYVNGKSKTAVATSVTLPASQDVYLDMKDDGTFVQVAVANGATTGMSLTLNSDGTVALRLAKFVTSATAITAVVQGGLDPLGRSIYNTNSSPYTMTGEIKIWTAPITPYGWLICDGSAISRTGYSSLFATIGTTFGVGDGSSTFNLPNTQGRTLAGQAASGTFGTLGGIPGNETLNFSHGHTTDAQGSHSHGGGTGYYVSNGGGSDVITTHIGSSPPSHYHGIGTDGSHGHNISGSLGVTSMVQPTLVIKHIIKT